jgi:hypothetical protein
MNFSARQWGRKWPFGAVAPRRAAMITAGIALCLFCAQPRPAQARHHAYFSGGELFGGPPPRPRSAVHTAKVPLPKPRPEEAPGRVSEEGRGAPETPRSSRTPEKPAEQAPSSEPAERPAPVAPQPSACRNALTVDIAIAPSIPPIHGPGGCGGEDLVRLEAIVLRDNHRVIVSPAATLRCPMASVVADWVRTDIAPLAQTLGSEIAGLDNFDSYDCRGFNGVKGAHLSQHGLANALDVHAFRLADGREIGLTDRTQPRALRENVLHSACARFTTVLGPDSDWYHEDHVHLDLAERRNNYRICQWDVLDPLPKIAPLLPPERPAEAPPRAFAGEEERGK